MALCLARTIQQTIPNKGAKAGMRKRIESWLRHFM